MPLWKLDNAIHCGKIIKSHGYLGSFKVAFFMPVNEAALIKNSYLYIEFNEKPVPYLIDEIQWQTDEVAVIKLADVNNEKQAQLLQNRHIWLTEKMLLEAEDSEPEINDLIGFMVFDEENNELGKITEIFESGPQDLIEVSSGEKSFLIPVHQDLITKIDSRKKYVFVELPEGLMDL